MKQTYENVADMVLFVEIARCRSFRHAAARLELPVATLSRRIAAMERRLGAQLLVRTTRSVALAHGAQGFYEQCVHMVEAAGAARHALAADRPSSERIRVSMPVDFGVELLGPIIASFAQPHPGLAIVFDLTPQARDLFRDPVDLVFRIGRAIDERVVARKVADIAAGLYAAPALVRAHPRVAAPADLERLPCLEMLSAQGPMAWRIGARRWDRAPGAARLSANNVGLLCALAERGHGVALLPRHLAERSVQARRLVPLLEGEAVAGWPLFAITAGRSVSGHVRALIAHVQAALGAGRVAGVG